MRKDLDIGVSEQSEKTKVLVIDDDRKLCRLVSDYLKPMEYQVTCTFNGTDGLEQLKKENHRAVVLDVMMPGMDGFEVLKKLRRISDVPVIMLTARGDETDRVVGLELGADDYLTKPFSMRELLARLRAVTRRYRRAASVEAKGEAPIVVGALRMEPDSRSVVLHGESMLLTSIEFDILLSLARAAGRVLSRDRLMDEIAGREHDVFDRTIDVHISALRRKLGDDPKNPRYIQTIRGTGYMLKRPSEDPE